MTYAFQITGRMLTRC